MAVSVVFLAFPPFPPYPKKELPPLPPELIFTPPELSDSAEVPGSAVLVPIFKIGV